MQSLRVACMRAAAIGRCVRGKPNTTCGGRAAFHFSRSLDMALFTENVPALGESITEGSVSMWIKQVGEPVAVDECVVVIETDKVSVDIKSSVAGVLTRQIGGDGDVAVGDALFEIDTEGEAFAAPPAPAPAAAPAPASAPAPAPAAAAAASPTGSRVPLIKFTHGKRSTPTPTSAPAPAPAAVAAPVKPGSGTYIYIYVQIYTCVHMYLMPTILGISDALSRARLITIHSLHGFILGAVYMYNVCVCMYTCLCLTP
eukprot:GSChrysophyteH1.ASY1.ANO1.2848.1 assembled CDS